MKPSRLWMPLILMAHGWAWADPQLATEALRHLIDKREPGQATPAPAGAEKAEEGHAGRRQEPLRPNETLDSLIRRTWPGLPSKDIWVRKTFVDLNPKAFVAGNPNLLQTGAIMTIPAREDLRQAFAAAHPQVAALFGPAAATASSSERSDKAQVRAHSGWVRFP